MKNVHRIIKFFAYALAALIIVGIIGGVISLLDGGIELGYSVSGTKTDAENIFESEEESILYIEIGASKVIIREGDILSGVTDNEHITVETRGNKLVAIETRHSSVENDDTYLDITIPSGLVFEKIVIKTGAGFVQASTLSCEDFELTLGAGKVTIDYLAVYNEADIEGGAGEFIVKDGEIHNIDAEMGVGKASIRAKLSGESDIESGIGELEIVLLGSRDDYKIKATTGIGEFRLDGDVIIGDKTIGDGESKVSVNNGIGSVKVNFE